MSTRKKTPVAKKSKPTASQSGGAPRRVKEDHYDVRYGSQLDADSLSSWQNAPPPPMDGSNQKPTKPAYNKSVKSPRASKQKNSKSSFSNDIPSFGDSIVGAVGGQAENQMDPVRELESMEQMSR